MPLGFSIAKPADVSLEAGDFNKRVVFQQEVDAPDGEDGVTRSWVTLYTRWAHLEPYRGNVEWRAQQRYPHSYYHVFLRYAESQNISAALRMQYGIRIYRILWVAVAAEALVTTQLFVEELQAKGSAH